MTIDCIPSRLLENAKTNPAAPAYYEKRGGQWVCTNFGDYAQHTRDAAKGLLALGLKAGGAVCILGFNRSEWSIMDVAAMMAGGVAAGIYTTCSATEVQYIVNHAEALVVLIENKLQWEKIQAERDNLPLLKHVVLMADSEPIEDPMVMTWNDFMEKGRAVSDADLDARMDSIKSEDLATLIYTSGTTGPPTTLPGKPGTKINYPYLGSLAPEVRH